MRRIRYQRFSHGCCRSPKQIRAEIAIELEDAADRRAAIVK